MHSLSFARARKHHVTIPDKATGCTTGNDAVDHVAGVNNDLLVGAWIKPTVEMSCVGTPPGTKYHVFSKWNVSAGQCAYKLWLETVDKNGGACEAASDLQLEVRAAFNDDSTNFSCASPCEVEHPTIPLPLDSVNGWNHVALHLSPEPSGQTATAAIHINGRLTSAYADTQGCNDNTNIPEGVGVFNSNEALFLGNETSGDADAFNGKIGEFMLFSGEELEVSDSADMLFLAHMEGRVGDSAGVFGGGGFIRQYLRPLNGPHTSVNGRYGKGITFDGVNEYLRGVNSVLEGYDTTKSIDSFSVEAWVYPHAVNRRQAIVGQWRFHDSDTSCATNTSLSSFALTLLPSGKLAFQVVSGGDIIEVQGKTAITANDWYHVTGLITPGTTTDLGANKMYLLLNGVDHTSGGAKSFSGESIDSGKIPLTVGAITADPDSVECDKVDAAMHFFDGTIDEVRINRWPNTTIKEQYDGGVVINEVDFKSTEERIELYYPSTMKDTINLAGWTLSVCSKTSKQFTLQEGCGNCASKDLDPGDIVKLVITDGVNPAIFDTSCAGAATTCQWTTDAAGTGTNLVAGDVVDAADGIVLYRGAMPTTVPQAKARMVDAVLWTDDAVCNPTASAESRGLWQSNLKMEASLITNNTKSLCLTQDGNNSQGVLSWAQCNISMGSLNASASTVIDLLSFDAVMQESAEAKISFQTGSELNSFGFKVLGANRAEGFYVEKSELIMARGGVGQGALYEFFDPSPSPYYKLKEIEVSKLENLFGPFQLSEDQGIIDASSSSADGSETPSADPTAAGDPVLPAAGCGTIVASENRAPGFLALFLVLVILASTRTHLFARRKD
jgi:hypothetical protein